MPSSNVNEEKADPTARPALRPNYAKRERQEVKIPYTGAQLATLEFPVHLANQNYAIVSYVGPDTTPKCNEIGFRVYGTFASLGEAQSVCEKAMSRGFKYFDLDIVDITHGFFPLPPPCDSDVDLSYHNKGLSTIMDRHKAAAIKQSDRVAARADALKDGACPTVAATIESLAKEQAVRLFEEWKEQGFADDDATVKKKVRSRHEEKLDEIRHGVAEDINSASAITAPEVSALLRDVNSDEFIIGS